MGQSYKQCTACGARALRIATRCPGCHREFPSTQAAVEAPAGRPQPASPRPRGSGLAAGVLVVAAVLTVTELGQTSGTAVESRPRVGADSSAGPSEVAYVSDGGTVRTETTPVPGPPARSAGELRVARTWTHVRKARSPRADLEAVLTPGDTVLADSLERGWYRVALDGEVLGYAYQSTLGATGAER